MRGFSGEYIDKLIAELTDMSDENLLSEEKKAMNQYRGWASIYNKKKNPMLSFTSDMLERSRMELMIIHDVMKEKGIKPKFIDEKGEMINE